ncbi:hypothetical protein STCU_12226 [Strigomonas culicis]|uniref:Uncharacterized protein n=1 Tax=Strigomonas culicis TaxID=28005 RepID=S9TB58_9TRYP|nr:hypothetical protein STCU_12226 [Strigomonas culicis]|eukprot:EPY15227.1 hypothetical protein STCU_12226 [Strigomonas culicis]
MDAMNRLFLDEFNGRIRIAEDFLSSFGELEKVANSVSASNVRADPMELLMKKEELNRLELEEDFMYGIERMRRREEKVRSQILGGYPARSTEDASGSSPGPLKPFVPPVTVLDRSAAKERDQYRGFELDEIGRFLLSYERDLLQLKQSILSKRQRIALEHDLLKETRDKAAQDIQRTGSGATWVPARPLPLSDLVRGPSVQYKK